MQPYLFPFLPYYLLVSNVDIFVFLDDVNLNTSSFINRNALSASGDRFPFTIPITKKSQNKNINEHFYSDSLWNKSWDSLLHFVLFAAKKKSITHPDPLIQMVDSVKNLPFRNVSLVNSYSVRAVIEALNLTPPTYYFSSELRPFISHDSRGVEAILEFCRLLGASTYINPSGGTHIYLPHRDKFRNSHISLKFVNSSQHLSEFPLAAFSVLASIGHLGNFFPAGLTHLYSSDVDSLLTD